MDRHHHCGFRGKIITPANPKYNLARRVRNRAIQKYPRAIIYCNDKYDVSYAVKWARQRGMGFRIRNGGHNYEGYSTGNRVLVIDISRINFIELSQDLLTIGGGVRNNQLYDFTASRGYPFPSGTCPTVGVSGLVLGGGWGLSCRKFGLACDSLVELQLVDYRGNILTVNKHCNTDLFWACRGAGGGNFGVVVSMTLRLPPQIEKLTFIEFRYKDTDKEMQANFLSTWQRWLANATDRATLVARIYHSAEDGFAIRCRGLFYGTAEEAKSVIAPLTALGECPLTLEFLPFIQAIHRIEEEYAAYESFKSTGRFVVNPLSADEIIKAVDLIREVPEGSVWNGLSLYALGGKTAQVSKQATAFYYRDAMFILGLQSVWTQERYAKINTQWVDRRLCYLCTITAGSYVNFPYCGLTDYLKAYYGENAGRLKLVKQKYDPLNLFCFPQSIGNAPTC